MYIKYIAISARLTNGYKIYIRMPITSIEESVKISNHFLYIIAIFVIIFGGIIITIVSRRFSKPIEELETQIMKIYIYQTKTFLQVFSKCHY